MLVSGVVGLDWAAELGSLEDPMRRRLYGYVAERTGPVTRDQAAASMGIGRTLAAYHLDKLADAGLLAVTYARPAGRGGPGAGRPAKLYELAERELAVSAPPRAYELLARLLVESLTQDPSGVVREAVHRAARDTGRRVAAEAADDLVGALRACGYLPSAGSGVEPGDEAGVIELRNCPFHRLAAEHRDLVCGLNLSLVDGVIAGSREPARAALRPRPGRCCVVVDRRAAARCGESSGPEA